MVSFKDEGYGYAMTLFHPYTVGCWGPASKNYYAGVCTSQAKVCPELNSARTADSVKAIFYTIAVLTLALIAF